LEVSGAVRPIYESLGVKRLSDYKIFVVILEGGPDLAYIVNHGIIGSYKNLY